MDTTRPIIYRDYLLNDPEVRDRINAGTQPGDGLDGCVVDSWDFSDVQVVQFLEKRSQQDGMDAGDVFLGARTLRMAGTLYKPTRNLLYDGYFELRKVLAPVLAQREEPADKGYRPLYFSIPTNRLSDYPELAIDMKVLALPRQQQIVFQRDQQGGDDANALAIPWQATFLQKDPNIYAAAPTEFDIAGTYTNLTSSLNNRGTYLCPVNMLIEVGAAAGTITVAIGGSNFVIAIPASTGNRIIRFKGFDKVITVEENSAEDLAYGILTFQNQTTWPSIPTGESPFTIECSVGMTLIAGSIMWFTEAWA